MITTLQRLARFAFSQSAPGSCLEHHMALVNHNPLSASWCSQILQNNPDGPVLHLNPSQSDEFMDLIARRPVERIPDTMSLEGWVR